MLLAYFGRFSTADSVGDVISDASQHGMLFLLPLGSRMGSASTPGFFPRLQEKKALLASNLVWHSKEQLPRRLDSVPSYVLSLGILFYHTGHTGGTFC